MKKIVFSFFALSAFVLSSSAQKLEDGIKNLYYEKYKSAESVLAPLGGSQSTDGKNIYWYGQALLNDPNLSDGVAQAKSLYQSAVSRGVNSPYVIVGLGEIDLLEKNPTAAKEKFEQAITASNDKKGHPDADVLNAIGRANGDVPEGLGDPAYAIEKLKIAEASDPKNPDIQINLGNNYIKWGNDKGGDAVTAYQKATQLDPKYARGYYQIGKIFVAQNNAEAYNEWFTKAVQADPAFAPTYYTYFKIFVNKDLTAASEYLEDYMKYSDPDCNTKALAVHLAYNGKNYDDAIAKAKAMEGEGCSIGDAYLYQAYSYRAKNEPAPAAAAISKYFQFTPVNKVQFITCVDATRLFLAAGHKDSAIKYYQLGYEVTPASNKVVKRLFADSAAVYMKELKYAPTEQYIWSGNRLRSNASEKTLKYDLGNYAIDAMLAANATKENKYYASADSAFGAFKKLYPDMELGYKNQAYNAVAWDTSYAKAIQPAKDYIDFLSKDETKNAAEIIKFRSLLGTYYANNTTDLDKSLAEYDAILKLDPNNETAKSAAELIKAKKEAASQISAVEEEQKKHDAEEKAYDEALKKAQQDSINDVIKRQDSLKAVLDSTKSKVDSTKN